MDTRAQPLLGPPVVAQTRPVEGCNPASPRRSRRGRDVLSGGAEAVDTEQVSAASDAVVSRETCMISVRVPTVVPLLAAVPHRSFSRDVRLRLHGLTPAGWRMSGVAWT